MTSLKSEIEDPSEDGHPCEAALEFRRHSLRTLRKDVPANTLDLAISFAWIGKALSRTTDCTKWLRAGVDPNTWEIIRIMAIDADARRLATQTAFSGDPSSYYFTGLPLLRESAAFQIAYEETLYTLEPRIEAGRRKRLKNLTSIATKLEGPSLNFPDTDDSNLVLLSQFRKRVARAQRVS